MFTSINPATGQPGDSIPELTADALDAAIARADSAYRAWRLTPIAERTALLERIAEQFEANTRELAEIATREMGKTLKSAIAEVQKCAAAFRHYAQEGPAMLEPRRFDTPGGPATAHWQPLGPVLAVMPWNFPFFLIARKMAPALITGNTIVIKSSEETPLNAFAFATLVAETELPAGASLDATKAFGEALETRIRTVPGVESLFMTVFLNQGMGKKKVAFGAPYPGKIIPTHLKELGGELIVQKDSFLCAAKGVSVGIAFQKRLGVGLFGGEGFIMERLTGDGWCFIHAGGTLMERVLQPGEVIECDATNNPQDDNPTTRTVALTREVFIDAEDFAEVPAQGVVHCRVPRLPLQPGSYHLELFSMSSMDITDFVPHAATLYVEAGDFFGSGRLPPADEGQLLVNHSWEVDTGA